MTPHRWRIDPSGSARCMEHDCERVYAPPQPQSWTAEVEALARCRQRYSAYYRDVAAAIRDTRQSLGWAS